MLSRWMFRRSKDSWFGDAVVLAFLFVQACDGVFTYIGLSTLGPDLEANPLLAALMGFLGTGPALTGVKVMAGSLGIALHLSGAHRVVAVLTAVYIGAAILPWAFLLY